MLRESKRGETREETGSKGSAHGWEVEEIWRKNMPCRRRDEKNVLMRVNNGRRTSAGEKIKEYPERKERKRNERNETENDKKNKEQRTEKRDKLALTRGRKEIVEEENECDG